jgi:Secretion system C-terminal sorting domain
MKHFLTTVLSLLLFSSMAFSQYTWQLKQSGNSLGNPIGVDKHNTNIVYYGATNKVYRSTDRGETFTQMGNLISGSSSIDAVIPSYYDQQTLIVSLHGSGADQIVKTTDAGQTWQIVLNGATFSYYGIPVTDDPSHPDTLYTESNNLFKVSTDFGDTWTDVVAVPATQSTPCDIEVFPDSSNIILIGNNGYGISRSTDYGQTWTLEYTTSGEIPTIATDKNIPGVAYATKWAGSGGFVKTTDYGATWTSVNFFNGNYMWGTDVNPGLADHVLTGCYSCGHIYMSKDGGVNWITTNIGSSDYAVYIVDSTTIFAAQGDGFYKLSSPYFTPVELTAFTASVKGNVVNLTWSTATELNNKGFEIEHSADDINFEKISFINGNGTTTNPHVYSYLAEKQPEGTNYYRLKQIDYNGKYNYSNTVEANVITPLNFELAQNHPNPFNPSTKIDFTIPTNSIVKITLFNLLGQKVSEITNSSFSAGKHSVNFNASNLSSGNYFYELEATGNNGQSFHSVKKMTLLK